MADLSSYTSLYRRFRPQRFSEVLGQGHVTKALINAVVNDQVSHAYLFSGPRGTGKTSTARILAKALNCTNIGNGEPCGECESCIAISEGRSFDVVELDAASNSGVDAIRSLIAQTPTGTFGKWKVYIIDEVHMLSTAASNALLKTLEEPPSHVVFVLATTDPQKVIATIKSRTQHYDFKYLDEGTLESLIGTIKGKIDLQIGQEAVEWSMRKGGGSARDTLSFLDQALALGYVPESLSELGNLVSALKAKDVANVFDALDIVLKAGQDPQRVCVDLIDQFRSIFLERIGVQNGQAPDSISSESVASFSASWLTKALTVLGETLDKMKDSLDPRIILEVALVKLLQEEPSVSPESLVARVAILEAELKTLKSTLAAQGNDRQKAAAEYVPEQLGAQQQRQAISPESNSSSRAQARGKIDSVQASPPRHSSSMEKLKSAYSSASASTDSKGVEKPDSLMGYGVEHAKLESVLEGEDQKLKTHDVKSSPNNEDSTQNRGVGLPTNVDEIQAIFKDKILPTLAPRTRSLYSASRPVKVEGSTVVLSVPNEAHKSHALTNLPDVRQGFANFYSTNINVELISDEILGEDHKYRSKDVEISETEDQSADLMQQFSNSPEVAAGGIDSQIYDVFPGAKKLEQ